MTKCSTLIVFLLLSFPSFSQRTIIHCGSLIDGRNKEVLSQMTIVVEGLKIVSLDKGFTNPCAFNVDTRPGQVDVKCPRSRW